MAWSLLIKNGTVVDGSGAPGVAADVALDGDRIAAIGPNLTGEAARAIDATGLMVAPGFIDIHSHSDLVYDKCPSAESKVSQGVTTEVVGMCGFSPGPIAPGRAVICPVRPCPGAVDLPVDGGSRAGFAIPTPQRE